MLMMFDDQTISESDRTGDRYAIFLYYLLCILLIVFVNVKYDTR